MILEAWLRLSRSDTDQLDDDFRGWLEDAYGVGAGRHLDTEPIR